MAKFITVVGTHNTGSPQTPSAQACVKFLNARLLRLCVCFCRHVYGPILLFNAPFGTLRLLSFLQCLDAIWIDRLFTLLQERGVVVHKPRSSFSSSQLFIHLTSNSINVSPFIGIVSPSFSFCSLLSIVSCHFLNSACLQQFDSSYCCRRALLLTFAVSRALHAR